MMRRSAVLDDQPPGTVYWLDHVVVPTNDLMRWRKFTVDILGAHPDPVSGLTTAAFHDGHAIQVCSHLPFSRIHGFLQREMLPPGSNPRNELPRVAFYIRAEDIDAHLRRLDEHHVPHSDPERVSEEGEDGTAIYFEDPDSNQMEFWAPSTLPPAAMEGAGPLGVGRISHAVFASRDLGRTAALFHDFCALDPLASADIPKNVLALGLAGGGRIIYHEVRELTGDRTSGSMKWRGPHTGLTVRKEDFWPSYRRMWDALPEWDGTGQPESLPARTALHASEGGEEWKRMYGRGDRLYDWDTNAFHLVGGDPINDSMLTYEPRYIGEMFRELQRDASGKPVV
jgi:hypothetical protein